MRGVTLCAMLLTSAGCGGDQVAPAETEAAPSTEIEGIRPLRTLGEDLLVKPVGITILPDGRLAVTDPERGVVEIFSADGEHLSTVDAEGSAMRRPMHAIAAGADALWVADFLTDQVVRVGLDGAVQAQVEAGLDAPSGVAVDSSGNLYIADFYHHQIAVVDPQGVLTARWGDPRAGAPLTYPTDVEWRDGELYVADAYGHQIAVYGEDGELKRRWGTKGSEPGQFEVATGIGTSDEGFVFVTDFENHRVQIFDNKGAFQGVFGHQGSKEGQLSFPTDVAVIGSLIHVVDSGNHRVQTFTWE